jgi:membrane-associated protease RseP (regulator of RpoE activity)
MGVAFAKSMFALNVALFLFNLLPLPPLDGGHLIPRSLEQVKEALAKYSFVILLAILFFGRSFLAPVHEAITRSLRFLVGW